MTNHTTSQRIQRALHFLGGLEHPVIIDQLASYGLDERVIEQGWKLLRAHARARPAPIRRAQPAPDLLDALDAWENRWFPIADASLRHRHPAVHRQLFANLGRTRGLKVIVSVGSLVERLRALEDRSDAEARAALAQLQQRGLDSAVMQQAETLLAKLQRPEPASVLRAARPSRATGSSRSARRNAASDAASDAESHAASHGGLTVAEARARAREAEQALWRWYREWSQISRAVIQEPEWLKHLGFGVPGRPRTAK